MSKEAMEPSEERHIRKWHDTLAETIEIRLLLTEDKRSDEFIGFAERLSQLAPKVRIRKDRNDDIDIPSILIGRNIRYHAVPIGKELEPFLDVLAFNNKPKNPISETVRGLRNISIPAYLDLYIAVQCAFCPTAVRKLTALAMESDSIRLSIIDAGLFFELAKKNGIRSVPTVLFDGQYRWTADFNLKDMVDMMVHRDPAKLSTAAIEGMLKEGEAQQVARMMLDHGTIFSTFVDLLVHEKWPVRLGAMVAMETIIETHIGLAAQAAPPLWERFQQVSDPVRGDILYIMGEIADEAMIPKLENIGSTASNKELKESAGEAIDRIMERHLKNTFGLKK